MSSSTKNIGTIGEQVLITEFIKHGIDVLLPIGDNQPYDIVILYNGRFMKVQVKTTENIKDGKMVFSTNITNPHKKTCRKYINEEIDLFGLYCIENNYIGLMEYKDYTAKDTIIRIEHTKNNQRLGIKLADDYKFENVIKKL